MNESSAAKHLGDGGRVSLHEEAVDSFGSSDGAQTSSTVVTKSATAVLIPRCRPAPNERLSAGEGLSNSRSKARVEPVKTRPPRALTSEQRDLLKKQIDVRVRERLARRGQQRTPALPDLSHLSRKKP